MKATSRHNRARSTAVTSATALSLRACTNTAPLSANTLALSDTAPAVSFFAFYFYPLFIGQAYYFTDGPIRVANAR
ncbi:MAG: hypothetical protein E7625_06095 [Ruminococcaceae bacterium]|nr:hypothetical protein [Oscillospiraceae bacterium]